MDIGQQEILIRMRFFLPAVMLGLFLSVFRTLTTAFGRIDQQIWSRFVYQRMRANRLRIALRGHAHLFKHLLQDWQQEVHPVIRTGLAQTKM